MKLLKILTIICFFVSGCDRNNINNQLIVTDKFEVIEKETKNVDTDTLVVFDCDYVLITFKDQIFSSQYSNELKECIEKSLAKFPGKNRAEKYENVKGMVLLSSESMLVDEKMPSLVKNLQNRGVKTLVLTKMDPGPCGKIKSLIDWRVNDLKRLGLDFSKSFINLNKKELVELSKENAPVYDKGILATGTASKGETLAAFLRYADLNPKKVIFIDDKKKQIDSVKEAMEKLKIQFVGINYTGEKNVKFDRPFSKQRLEYQFKIFQEQGRYLSDAKADEERKKLGLENS